MNEAPRQDEDILAPLIFFYGIGSMRPRVTFVDPQELADQERALLVHDKDMTPRLRAAQLAHRTHQNALARAYLDRVLADDPHSAPALYLRGLTAAEDGDRAGARQFLDQALNGVGEVDREAVQRLIRELDAPVRTRRR